MHGNTRFTPDKQRIAAGLIADGLIQRDVAERVGVSCRTIQAAQQAGLLPRPATRIYQTCKHYGSPYQAKTFNPHGGGCSPECRRTIRLATKRRNGPGWRARHSESIKARRQRWLQTPGAQAVIAANTAKRSRQDKERRLAAAATETCGNCGDSLGLFNRRRRLCEKCGRVVDRVKAAARLRQVYRRPDGKEKQRLKDKRWRKRTRARYSFEPSPLMWDLLAGRRELRKDLARGTWHPS